MTRPEAEYHAASPILTYLRHGALFPTCQTLLHTYLSVPEIEDANIEGFHGVGYFDQVLHMKTAIVFSQSNAAFLA